MVTEDCNVMLFHALYDVDDFLSEPFIESVFGTIFLGTLRSVCPR